MNGFLCLTKQNADPAAKNVGYVLRTYNSNLISSNPES